MSVNRPFVWASLAIGASLLWAQMLSPVMAHYSGTWSGGSQPVHHMSAGSGQVQPAHHMFAGSCEVQPAHHMFAGSCEVQPAHHMFAGSCEVQPAHHVLSGNGGTPPVHHSWLGVAGSPPVHNVSSGSGGTPPAQNVSTGTGGGSPPAHHLFPGTGGHLRGGLQSTWRNLNNNSPVATGGQVTLQVPSYFTQASSGNTLRQSFVHAFLITHDNHQRLVNSSPSKQEGLLANGGSSHRHLSQDSLHGAMQHSWRAGGNNGSWTAGSPLLFQMGAGSFSTTGVPLTVAQAQQQINDVLNNDWASWTGKANGTLTVAQVGQLLLNSKVTGSQAAVLGMIADLMNIYISDSGNASNYSPSCSLSQIKSFMSSNVSYYASVMGQLASSTNSNGTFNLYGSYKAPVLSAIYQGGVGDCYFISSIDGVLNVSPQLIANMIAQNANGTFTVTFPGGSKQNVTLTDGEIAQFSFALNNGCWLAVMGMAEAQVLAAHPVAPVSNAQKATPLGIVVDGGYQTQVLSLLTGQSYSELTNASKQYTVSFANSLMTQSFAKSDPIGVDSWDHALDIVSFNASSQLVTILNPWGTSGTYQPESYSRVTVQMVNGRFTLTTTQMLSDFVELTVPTSILNGLLSSGATKYSPQIDLVLNNVVQGVSNVSSNATCTGGLLPSVLPLSLNTTATNLMAASLATLQTTTYGGMLNQYSATRTVGRTEQSVLSETVQSDLVPVSCSQVDAISDEQMQTSVVWADNYGSAELSGQAASVGVSSQRPDRKSVFEMGQGSMFVLRKEACTIKAGSAIVQVAPQAAAFIVQVGQECVVHNFMDKHQGDIAVVVGEKRIVVPMGKALFLSCIDAEQPAASPLAGCVDPHRVTRLGKHGDATAFLGHIAYAQAFKNCPQFRQFMHSDLQEERAIARKVLKASAACLTLAAGN